MVTLLLFLACGDAVMNAGGVPYKISNPSPPGTYSIDFEHNVPGEVDQFDVYGEVQTRYSQVYWTRNLGIPLPPALVEKFKGKVMAITGYEVDQVTHTGSKPGYVRGPGGELGGFACYPSCDLHGEDTSVPIYHAYNHHYFSWLTGAAAELHELEEAVRLPNPTHTSFRQKAGTTSTYPSSIVFKENPGGEFRKSYHGYPGGWAQLLESPDTWVVEPMQIDTHNRKFNITDTPGYVASFLPKQMQTNMTEFSAALSPLIECPCSDRITKAKVNRTAVRTSGACRAVILTAAECQQAVIALTGQAHVRVTSQCRTAHPPGCSIHPKDGKFEAVFNDVPKDTHATCADLPNHEHAPLLRGAASLAHLTNLSISSASSGAVTLEMEGPADVWFGIAFGARSMAQEPYALIVDGKGEVSERRLGNHAPGSALPSSITVQSSRVEDGRRQVTLSRPAAGASSQYYTFPSEPGAIDVITAVGSTPTLSYHKARSGASITLLPAVAAACVCAPTTLAYVTYMDTTTEQFQVVCTDEPRGDMLRHGDGTGRDLPNMACDLDTYHGGLRCCKHSWFLTDRGQDVLIPPEVDTYFLKWRYYFQEYTPVEDKQPASHKHLHHWVFLIDAQVNDYEEDNAEYGQKSVGKITAHLTGSMIGLEDLPASPPSKLSFHVMTPHCHAPSCVRQELWNADTDELLCSVTAEYGDAQYGPLNDVFNEADYAAIPPCIFGHQAGLAPPPSIALDTNLTAVKYFDNTFRHLGQMAQWTGLMSYDTDPY